LTKKRQKVNSAITNHRSVGGSF